MGGSRAIGIDLGGTKIEGVVLDPPFDEPRIVERIRVPTEASEGGSRIGGRVLDMIRRLEGVAGSKATVGVGMPGSVDEDGRVRNSNTVCLNGTFFRRDLEERLGRPIAFANDANCFALAEARYGAGRGYPLVVGLILGTGTGGGIAIDGKVREGPQSLCGEWGHAVLRPLSERRCYCGKNGCVETYLAGPWIERDYLRRSGRALPLERILEVEAADPAAAACVDRWLDSYGMALGNLINTLDPDVVVLGGGVSNAGPLLDRGNREIERYLFAARLRTPVVRNELGDSSGVLGAALLVE